MGSLENMLTGAIPIIAMVGVVWYFNLGCSIGLGRSCGNNSAPDFGPTVGPVVTGTQTPLGKSRGVQITGQGGGQTGVHGGAIAHHYGPDTRITAAVGYSSAPLTVA